MIGRMSRLNWRSAGRAGKAAAAAEIIRMVKITDGLVIDIAFPAEPVAPRTKDTRLCWMRLKPERILYAFLLPAPWATSYPCYCGDYGSAHVRGWYDTFDPAG